jgi:signal transduction histidine kinase
MAAVASRSGLEPGPALRYVRIWWVLGALTLAGSVVAVLLRPVVDDELRWWALLVVVGLAFLTDVSPLRTPIRRESVSINLYEVAVLVGFALLPPLVVPAAIVGGIASSLVLVHRIAAEKVLFNAAMLSVATTAGAVLVETVGPARPAPTDLRGLLVLLGAGFAFGLVNQVALAGLLRRLQPARAPGSPPGDYLRASGIGMTVAVSLGVILAGIVVALPLVLPLFGVVTWLTLAGLAKRSRRMTGDAVHAARLERTIAGATEGICLLDATGAVELLNPAACRLLGVAAQEVVGRRLDDLLPGSVSSAATVTASLQDRTLDDPEAHHTVRIGPTAWQLELTALFDHHARPTAAPTGAVVLFWDATEDLRATRTRQEFVARVSHELRTPLTAILGFAETLRVRLDALEPERQREFLTVIERQGVRLSRLVDDLLWSARSEAGTISSAPEPVVLRRLAIDVTASVHHLLDDARLEWSVGDTVVLADRGHLEQVLINLVTNATTYGAAPYRITARTRGDRAIIEVSDGGAGVPAAFVPHLFDPFAQASTGDRREARGLGLGLAIVHTLLAHNDGTITYDRRDGRSVFVLTLPSG